MSQWVAITGAAGYIGGQTALRFKDLGYNVLGVDRSWQNALWMQKSVDMIIPGDITSDVFAEHVKSLNCQAVIHIAGTSLVGPSVRDPAPYYQNNVANTALLLKKLSEHGWTGPIVFSSSAAVYGNPSSTRPLLESDIGEPCSPYGWSKWMAEQVLRDTAAAYGHSVVALRYFNACGADHKQRHGQVKGATHIIARIMESFVNGTDFKLNGQDYSTPDGTCVRDYLHVEDIAQAHVDAIGIADRYFQAFNLGTGQGYSNLEIMQAAEQIVGKELNYTVGPRRAGDPAQLIACPDAFIRRSRWVPANSKLDNIIKTGWQWYNSPLYQVSQQ